MKVELQDAYQVHAAPSSLQAASNKPGGDAFARFPLCPAADAQTHTSSLAEARLSRGAFHYEIPTFLLQGAQEDARPEPAGKPEWRGCLNPSPKAPLFFGWTQYGYWTRDGRLIGGREQ